MQRIITFVIISFLSNTVLSAEIADDECESIQYLTVGENGLIACSFEAFVAISWYNSEENRDILFYKDGVKTGEGFFSGEYDVYPNGSLLVRNVTLEHEGIFTVSKVISLLDGVTARYDIQVNTVVKPTTSYPSINVCVDETPPCLISVISDGYIHCQIDYSRPPVKLSWIEKKHGSGRILNSSYSYFSYDNITYISQSTVTYSVSKLGLLNMFICQVSSIPNDLVLEQYSVVLLAKSFDYTETVSPDEVQVEVGDDMILLCSKKSVGSVVWKQLRHGNDFWSTILYTIPHPKNFTEHYLTGFDVDSDGRLSLRSIKIEHEGLYVCVQQDDREEDVTLYDVKVYASPDPAYPVIDGCNHQQYCVLHVTDGDFLNCSIRGIRPKVILEWRELHYSDEVLFEDQTLFVENNKDLFDITLTARVLFSASSGNRVTVECRVTKSDTHRFELSTTMDVLHKNVHLTDRRVLDTEDSSTILMNKLFIIGFVIATNLLLLLLLLLLNIFFRKRATTQIRRARRTPNNEEDGERHPMLQDVHLNSHPTSEKQNIFITQLKTRYETLYDSVQPIPYMDRMYCVEKVYVEGGIEHLTDVDRGIWKSLNSYRELLTPTCLNSKRQIIEGEPGYGKSTLMLQLVYDWCSSMPPPRDVDIIIYLRLRQLSGITSVATAIKQSILPKDTSLSEDDINAILSKFSHILLLLDGFDEYPDKDDPESFVYLILKKQLFQDAEVILTTRSLCFPKKLTGNINRVRLTGFKEKARNKYIAKAVTRKKNRKTAQKIKRKPLENPVFGDLYVVPLFFVLFAHIANENNNLPNFRSVTRFVSIIIECFHGHLRNKMDLKNVTDSDTFKEDHKLLDKLAFEALHRKNHKRVWERADLIDKLGQEFYKQYVRLGVLVEKEVLLIADESRPFVSPRCKWEVKFNRKLFCEWYAACHLSEYLRDTDCEMYKEVFKHLDPYDLQYLYRFTCGLDQTASTKVVQHFLSSDKNKIFAVLCMLEQSSNDEEAFNQIRHLVSFRSTSIKKQDTKLLQRSTTEILDIASKNKILITCVTLKESFHQVDHDEIKLKSGLTLPRLLTMEKIEIWTEAERELTEENVIKIFEFAIESQKLQEIRFVAERLPTIVSLESIPARLISRSVEVLQFTTTEIKALNFQTGEWKTSTHTRYFDGSSSNVEEL